MSILSASTQTACARAQFDASLLTLGNGISPDEVDLSQFEEPGAQPEGRYLVDIRVNGTLLDTRTLNFVHDERGNLVPELTRKDLDGLGVNVGRLESLKALPEDVPVGDISRLIPDASARLDLAKLSLNLSVPQIAMKPNFAQGLADPSRWDEGMPALLMNYMLSGSHNQSTSPGGYGGQDNKYRSDNLFGSLNGGMNLGPWRLRSRTSWSHNSGHPSDSPKFNNTYVQRNLQAWRSELTMGETSTSSDVFDSIPMRGVQLRTADEMTPDSMRGFAPVVSGIARSNAQVSVIQNERLIYQTYVAPGAFRIEDISQAGSEGDLTVIVKEADGTEHRWTQAYSGLPIMQREGHAEYEVAAGKVYHGSQASHNNPLFVMGSLMYGLPHDITVYGGLLGAEKYQAGTLGTGVSLGVLGAMSADMTLAHAVLMNGERNNGQSFRLKYSKSMLTTGSSVDLTAFRYSTQSYYTLEETTDPNQTGHSMSGVNDMGWMESRRRRRSAWQMSLSQSLGDFGSLSLSGTREDYWNSDRVMNRLMAGYSTSLGQVSLGVSYSIDHMSGASARYEKENRQLALNMSVPLSIFSGNASRNMPYLNYYASQDQDHRINHNVGVSGNIGESQWGYSLSENWGNQGQHSATSAGLNYDGGRGAFGVSHTQSARSRNTNFSASGGVVAHPHGVTLSRTLGNSMALVSTQGVSGVPVMNGGGITTDYFGYAVVPYLQNYRDNAISLDPTGLPDDVTVNDTSRRVTPTKGALVMAEYKVRTGRQALMLLTRPGGKIVPFGAIASLEGEDDITGMVGDNGQLYISGLPEKGHLNVSWGRSAEQRCAVDFKMPVKQEGIPVTEMAAVCRPQAGGEVAQLTPVLTEVGSEAPLAVPLKAKTAAQVTDRLTKETPSAEPEVMDNRTPQSVSVSTESVEKLASTTPGARLRNGDEA
ncbi:fimbria/pilus outer membrane usher protein [Escherichia coli]|uniref:fimbria/pilus outer membrane usher protein n=1 Tax=Escherichia coli TaxID=562 RepID=UPI001CDAA8F6|nr:fimbria/pilus outer membrane usher protein [Escherichia coli]